MKYIKLIFFLALFGSPFLNAQHFHSEESWSDDETDYHKYRYKNMAVTVWYERVYVFDVENYMNTTSSFNGWGKMQHTTMIDSKGTIIENNEETYHASYNIDAGDSLKFFKFDLDSARGMCEFGCYTFLGRKREETSSLKTSQTKELKIYPNPVDNIIKINLEDINDSYSYMIYDILGNAIIGGNNIKDELNLWYLKSGEYILQIQTKENTYSSKFIKL